jgi:hypothetical protein
VGGRAKWEFRTDKTSIGLYTRNYRIKLASGTKETSDGILGGQYVQPVTEWIFPEVVTPGATPPPLDFTGIGPLANGFGPDENGNVFHQLNPWPGAVAPTPLKTCPDHVDPAPPGSTDPVTLIADVGTDQVVRGGVLVSLLAKQTASDINANDLAFHWTQTLGPTTDVVLSGAESSSASFEAPIPASGTVERNFRVLITHKPSNSTANDTIVVTTDTTSSDHPVIDTFTWVSRQSGTVSVTAHTDLIAAAASMRVSVAGGAEQTMTKVGPGRWSYTARSTPQPASVTVKSYLNNVAVGAGVTKTSVSPGKRSLRGRSGRKE